MDNNPPWSNFFNPNIQHVCLTTNSGFVSTSVDISKMLQYSNFILPNYHLFYIMMTDVNVFSPIMVDRIFYESNVSLIVN